LAQHHPRALSLVAATACLLTACAGCGKDESTPADQRTAAADKAVRAKWGKSLADLPVVQLEIVSPHNENIIQEFEWAFSLHHALEYGQRVDLVESQVGGGGSSIEKYLLNVYANAPSSGIDVLWGGGDFAFATLAKNALLEPMTLRDDVPANVPAQFGGLPMLAGANAPPEGPRQFLWIGSAVSGFGFLYNEGILRRLNIAAPARWEDLADRRFTDLLEVADPGQSASAAAAFRMIVVSEPTWPAGWARLLQVLSNTKRFADSAGSAANAPVLGEAPVATCIDFYGIIRVAEAPRELVYVSPPGQTTFSPDPIAILKNPPHSELAQRFVDFVMSARGQALWALRIGEKDGPVRFVLGRQPIRRDVYEIYAGKMAPRIVNPYQAGQALEVSPQMQQVNFTVLRQLIISATVDNVNGLRTARRRLNELSADPSAADEYARRLAEFNRLPEDIDTLEKMNKLAGAFKDPKQFRAVTVGWRDFFADKFAKAAK
jgi:ABC-type Fe3+ transport system substrate-binding protein